MVKIRLTITVEYETNPQYYKEGLTPQQIMEEDLAAVEDDFSIIVATLEDNEFTIKGEVIE